MLNPRALLSGRRPWGVIFTIALAGCAGGSDPDGQFDPIPEFASISAGGGYTCALTASGALWCWGINTAGRLGTGGGGPAIGETVLYPTPSAQGLAFSSIGTGAEHMCAVTTAGAGYCWGLDLGLLGAGPRTQTLNNEPVAVAGGHLFRAIEAGFQHTCGVTAANDALCWGENFSHQLGIGAEGSRSVPSPVAGGIAFADISNRVGSSGQADQNSCGLDLAGQAWCWGGNQGGALGTGTIDPVGSDVPVHAAEGETFSSISASGGYVCGIATGGGLLCWGRGAATPVPMAGASDWSSVSVGSGHSCAISLARDLYCWGSNTYGQLGLGAAGAAQGPPTLVPGGRKWVQVSVGALHTCAIADDDTAWCWGFGDQGELGIGELPSHDPAIGYFSPAPVQVARERPRQ